MCACVCTCAVLVGCGSPPSVLPLLEVAERAVRAEAEHLETGALREAQWLEQARQALERAYELDLDAQSEPTRAWILEATRAYVIAREELVRHELHLREQRARRRENLHAAADATRRAAVILAQQDELITQVLGTRAWEWLGEQEPR